MAANIICNSISPPSVSGLPANIGEGCERIDGGHLLVGELRFEVRPDGTWFAGTNAWPGDSGRWASVGVDPSLYEIAVGVGPPTSGWVNMSVGLFHLATCTSGVSGCHLYYNRTVRMRRASDQVLISETYVSMELAINQQCI